jgi:hypothetical protein
MKLSVIDRVVIQQVLPIRSNFLNYKIITELRSELSFSEKEVVDFGMKTIGNEISWERSEDKEVVIGETAMKIIHESFEKLDREGGITSENASTYMKFMIDN